jgi:4,5-dihydroxyphthalate decarboxylase
MAKLALSVAVGDYDRTRPLIDGTVRIDGVEPTSMTLTPEEIFFRAFRDAPFDVCELSLSSFTLKTATGDCPYVGVPAFVSRAFRHNSIYVRTDRIKTPEDLKDRRVGLPDFHLTASLRLYAVYGGLLGDTDAQGRIGRIAAQPEGSEISRLEFR